MGSAAGTPQGWHRLLRPLRSVRVRITLAAVAVTAVAVGTAGALLVRTVEDSQTHQVRQDISRDLDEVVARLRDGRSIEEAADVESTSGFVFLQITDGESMVATFAAGPQGAFLPAPPGATGGHTAATPDADLPPDEGESSSGPTGTRTEVSVERKGGQTADAMPPGRSDAMVDAVDQRAGLIVGAYETISRTVDTDDGELTVTAAVPVDQLAGTVGTLRQGLLVGLPVLIAVVAALAWVLVGRALRPVEAVRAEVDAIGGSTMHRRVPEPATGDEIGRLARTMNAMLGRLDAAATRQRQFVSDASHELRSPVAALRTCLEVARRNPDRADWPAVADTALAEEARLEALLDDLLLLTAHDEGAASSRPAGTVDVEALVRAEAGRPRRVPVAAALPDRVDPPDPGAPADPPAVQGSVDSLRRALSNLVDNAARHATSAVHVGVARHGDAVRVAVEDDGPGIPPADRERIFERFTRLDDARARPEGGTGLGLAVVRSIVSEHGGRVWAEEGPRGGARLVVELPALAPDPVASGASSR